MTNMTPTPTSSTIKPIDSARFLHTTTWQHGKYTLISRRSNHVDTGFSTREWTVRCNDSNLPDITDNADYGSDTPEFGINWSAMGDRTTAEARAYGHALLDAAATADHFTTIAASLN